MQKTTLLVSLFLLAIVYSLFFHERQPNLVSDSGAYFDEAVDFWKANVPLSDKYKFFQSPGFPLSLGLFLKFFGENHWVGFLFQLIVYLSTIFLILTHIPQKTTTSVKWLIYLSLAINVAYVPLLGTLLSEVWFGLWFMVGSIYLYRYVSSKQSKSYYLFICFIAFLIAQFIRPVAFYYILFLWIFGSIIYSYKTKRLLNVVVLKGGLSVLLFLLISIFMYRTVGYGNRWQPVQDGTWGIYYGLNPKGYTQETYNEDMAWVNGIVEQKGWGEELKDSLRSGIRERANTAYSVHLSRLPQNFIHLVNPYKIAFSGVLSRAISHESRAKKYYKIIFLASSILILLVYIANTFFFFKTIVSGKKYHLHTTFFVISFLSFIAYLVLHLLTLEPQPRYICHFVLLNCWLFAFHFQQNKSDNLTQL